MKRHPYIILTLAATLLAIAVWFCVPKEYGAQTVVSDEYKETDIFIGLDRMKAFVNEQMGSGNDGVNNIEIYSKILKTSDFARGLATIHVPETGMTYAQYLDETDTLQAIKDRIAYNLSTQKETMTIQFTDRDPKVAAMMLDSVVQRLQDVITSYRHAVVSAKLKDAKAKREKARAEYDNALKRSAAYGESHNETTLESENAEQDALNKECEMAHQAYAKASEDVARQESLLRRSYMSFAVVKSNSIPVEPTTHLWQYILVIVITVLGLAKAGELFVRKCRKGVKIDLGDVFSPWSLTIGIWAVNLILIALQSDMLYPLQDNFWLCFAVWIVLFVPSSYIAYLTFLKPTPTVMQVNSPEWNFNMTVFNVLWGISMILSPLYLYTVMKIVMMFDTQDMLFNIRYLAVYGGATNLLLNSVQGINMALFIVAIWLYPRISGWRLLSIIAAYLTVEFAMMEKSGILVMILSTLFVLYQRRVITVRGIGVTLLLTVVLFFFFNMSKELDDDSGESQTFLDFFAIYITTPAVAFGYLTQDLSQQFGVNTFGQVFQYLNAFGFSFETAERLQEFVYVPVPTNVYTIMQPFYEDFGVGGVAFFAVAYGYLFGFTYSLYRSGSNFGRCVYTYFIEVILIQFYNENLLQNFFLSCGLIFWTFCITQPYVSFGKKE